MKKTEEERFDKVLEEGFRELNQTKPEKPLEHFVYFILNNISKEVLHEHPQLTKFCENYGKKQAILGKVSHAVGQFANSMIDEGNKGHS